MNNSEITIVGADDISSTHDTTNGQLSAAVGKYQTTSTHGFQNGPTADNCYSLSVSASSLTMNVKTPMMRQSSPSSTTSSSQSTELSTRTPHNEVLAFEAETSNDTMSSPKFRIVDVWAHNLQEALDDIKQIVKHYPFIAMDTEFPGVVARPLGNFHSISDYHYQTLKVNVDMLRIIQLGLSFFNEEGKMPDNVTTYQFNFQFRINADIYAKDSILLLRQSGIDFERLDSEGIYPHVFAEAVTMSGLFMMDNVVFLSFHSGYDFGYLIKLLTSAPLPMLETEFFETLKIFFPNIYDVKYLMKSCKSLKGGLEEVAKQLDIARFGPSHQAGSDSLLTGLVFFRIKELYFDDNIDEMKYSGHLFGLGVCSLYAPANTGNMYTTEVHNNPMNGIIPGYITNTNTIVSNANNLTAALQQSHSSPPSSISSPDNQKQLTNGYGRDQQQHGNHQHHNTPISHDNVMNSDVPHA